MLLLRIPRLAAPGLAAILLLTACGQKGALYIPNTPAAAQRATLPQTVFGGATAAPATPTSQPPAAPPPLPDLPDAE
ncbi:MAG TPA: lipoprotein [Ottowia sp.]|uniref:LPS translocon maturation chaperone LptM n=1 Tax=Ottowia sp. TaxID=1898956 RepID=UPI002CA2CE18|nr:lipoprotein [Ottowia sp.]HMN20342.1 lipoprotein [Ottowia sp.]